MPLHVGGRMPQMTRNDGVGLSCQPKAIEAAAFRQRPDRPVRETDERFQLYFVAGFASSRSVRELDSFLVTSTPCETSMRQIGSSGRRLPLSSVGKFPKHDPAT